MNAINLVHHQPFVDEEAPPLVLPALNQPQPAESQGLMGFARRVKNFIYDYRGFALSAAALLIELPVTCTVGISSKNKLLRDASVALMLVAMQQVSFGLFWQARIHEDEDARRNTKVLDEASWQALVKEQSCCICLDEIQDPAVVDTTRALVESKCCQKLFHKPCIDVWYRSKGHWSCPNCRVTKDNLYVMTLRKVV